MNNKRLLFITRHRLNENNGGSNASKGFIRCFANLFDDCSLIYPEYSNPYEFIPQKYQLYPCHDGRSNIRKGLDMYRGVVSPLSSFVGKHLQTHRYDVIVIDHSFIASSLIKTVKASGSKIVTIHHNVERDYLHDNRGAYGLAYRFPYIFFGEKAEKDCLKYSDVNLTVTENDAEEFRTWPECEGKAVHCWGIFEFRPMPDKVFPKKTPAYDFVITGSLSFQQSLLPIIEFLNQYWPLVKARCNGARLVIAGRNPDERLMNVCRNDKSVTVVPNPDDIAVLVRQSSYYICPINMGSGRKLRIFDALKEGLLVLCHKQSMAGYEDIARCGCMFPYSDAHTFEASLDKMLAADVSPEKIYHTFRSSLSIASGTNRLSEILRTEQII